MKFIKLLKYVVNPSYRIRTKVQDKLAKYLASLDKNWSLGYHGDSDDVMRYLEANLPQNLFPNVDFISNTYIPWIKLAFLYLSEFFRMKEFTFFQNWGANQATKLKLKGKILLPQAVVLNMPKSYFRPSEDEEFVVRESQKLDISEEALKKMLEKEEKKDINLSQTTQFLEHALEKIYFPVQDDINYVYEFVGWICGSGGHFFYFYRNMDNSIEHVTVSPSGDHFKVKVEEALQTSRHYYVYQLVFYLRQRDSLKDKIIYPYIIQRPYVEDFFVKLFDQPNFKKIKREDSDLYKYTKSKKSFWDILNENIVPVSPEDKKLSNQQLWDKYLADFFQSILTKEEKEEYIPYLNLLQIKN